jgi:hypothetical protein
MLVIFVGTAQWSSGWPAAIRSMAPYERSSINVHETSCCKQLRVLKKALILASIQLELLPGRLSPGTGETNLHSSTGVQPSPGSNSLIAIAVSVVVFPKSFWSNTPSWLMMKVITPELPYSAG